MFVIEATPVTPKVELSDVALVTPSVPAIAVLPLDAVMLNLLLLTATSPVTFNVDDSVVTPVTANVVDRVVAPDTPNVPAIEVFPDAAVTINLFVLIVKLPLWVTLEMLTKFLEESTTAVLLILYSLPDARFKCSDEVHADVELIQLNVLFVDPLSVKPPPSAVTFVGETTLPNSMFLSSIVIVTEFTVVVVPFTVKFPVTVMSPPTEKLLEPEIVTGALKVEVALTVNVSVDSSPNVEFLFTVRLLLRVAADVTYKVEPRVVAPPTLNCDAIPAPPDTTKAPMFVADESVVLEIVVTPVTPKVDESVTAPLTPSIPEIEVLPVAPSTLNLAVSPLFFLPTKRPSFTPVPPT